MAEKRVKVKKRSWSQTAAWPLIILALGSVLVLSLAECCCKHSIDARETGDKPGAPSVTGGKWEDAQSSAESTPPAKSWNPAWQDTRPLNPPPNSLDKVRADQLFELRQQEQQLLSVFGVEHPQVISVRNRIALILESQPGQGQRPANSNSTAAPANSNTVIKAQWQNRAQAPFDVQEIPASAGGPSKQIAQAAQQPPEGPIINLPQPRPLEALNLFPGQMLAQGDDALSPLGSTPRPTAKDLAEFAKYITGFGDPKNSLDLIKGRSRLMMVKATPKKIQISDETIVSSAIFGPTEITLLGKTIGTTVLNLWFPSVEDKNKDVVLSYLVRVLPDPEEKRRLEAMYKALENDINRTFHDSVIHLQLVGDKVVVTGQALDINDATQILRIVSAKAPGGATAADVKGKGTPPTETVGNAPRPDQPNAATPGQENYLPSGNPNVINMMTIPGVQQVQLKVVVAEVNRTAARSIGLNFSVTNNQGLQVIQNQTGSLVTPIGFGNNGLGAAVGGAAGTGLSGISPLANVPVALSNGQVILAINALKSMHYAKSLAEPNLTTNSGHAATFLAGGQFPVPVTVANAIGGLQGTQFVPYGVSLNFTPYITDKDRIRLNVSVSVSTRDTTTGAMIGNSNVPGLTARNFTSTIDLREGQTLAVAGLLQTNLGTDRDQLPFLAEVPLLNRLTGFDRTSAGEQELIVLITPELVQPMKKGSQIPRLPGSDLFEPSDLEFYLLGRLEGRRRTDFRSPVMTDYHRIRQYNRCEQTYIFGPSGYVTLEKAAK